MSTYTHTTHISIKINRIESFMIFNCSLMWIENVILKTDMFDCFQASLCHYFPLPRGKQLSIFSLSLSLHSFLNQYKTIIINNNFPFLSYFVIFIELN
jgi:hypothetical protein